MPTQPNTLPTPRRSHLLRDIGVVLVIKLLVLAALWWAFIRDQRVGTTRRPVAAAVCRHGDVPLPVRAADLGMVWLLVIMESVYVMTGKVIWKDMTRFWGKLFGINFALGVTTGITLEFQFGTNWAYYSHYVGDIFGAPLAIEGLMAFFLESTFIGLFFFGWDRLSKTQHLLVTTLMAVGTNLSALWILIANGWMQNPVGAEFSYVTMRMEMTDFWAVVFNPDAQAKFVHTVSAGYVTGAMFVLSVSAWYLLKRARRRVRQAQLPRRGGLRPGFSVLFGHRAGRRIRLHRGRSAADQDGRDGGHVGDRARPGRPDADRRHQRGRAERNDWESRFPGSWG
jgi:hypothetical protein